MSLVFHNNQAMVEKGIGPGGHPWAKAYVPAKPEDLVGLPTVDRLLDLDNWPKISFETILFVRRYFAEVYRLWTSEAFVLFHRGLDDDDYTVVSPPWYTASAGHVRYDPNVQSYCPTCQIGSIELKAGAGCPMCAEGVLVEFCCAGTAHSHGAGGAGHSSVDDANELNQTGFHITLGKVNAALFEIAPSFVTAIPGYRDENAKGVRHNVGLEDLVTLPFPQGGLEKIQFWLNRIANPGLGALMIKGGMDPEDVAVAVNVDDPEKLGEASVLRFVGTMDQLAHWRARMGGAARVVTSWAQAHAAIDAHKKALAEEAAKKKPYGAGSSSSVAGFPRAFHQIGSTAGGSKSSKTGSKKGGLSTLGNTDGPSPSAWMLTRQQTAEYAIVMSSSSPYMRLIRSHKNEAGGTTRTWPTEVFKHTISFADSSLTTDACLVALSTLVEQASAAHWFKEDPASLSQRQDDYDQGLLDGSEVMYDELIELVLEPLEDLLDTCLEYRTLETRELELDSKTYASNIVTKVFGKKQTINQVIEQVIADNLSYVEAYGIDSSNDAPHSPVIEWLRMVVITLNQLVDINGFVIRKSDFVDIREAVVHELTTWMELIGTPDEISEVLAVAESRALKDPKQNYIA